MLVAQALGEYGALAAVADAVSYGTTRFEEVVGEWGTEGLIALVVAVIVWRVVIAVR